MTAGNAGWWRRFVGYVIDSAIINAVATVLGFSRGMELLLAAAYWVVLVGYPGHATVGMRVLGMHVVPSDGRPDITYVDALVRWLMMLVGLILLGIGFLVAAWDVRRQAWHDQVARTLVMRL